MTMETRAAAAQQRAAGMRAPADRPRERSGVVSAALERAEVASVADGPTLFVGYASVTERAYDMFDMFGEYSETVSAGAFAATLAASPQVEFVTNHARGGQIPLAHTRNGTLRLSEDATGLRVEADLDPTRHDVHDALAAIERGDLAEMSFRFRIDAGRWSPDWTEYRIDAVDMDRGDVSVVNFGANPHTADLLEISGRADAGTEHEARDESSAAPVALGDDLPAATPPTTERSPVMDEVTPVESAAPVVESTPEVREDHNEIVELRAAVARLTEDAQMRANAQEAAVNSPKYDEVARVGAESRTYRPDLDARGGAFLRDVVMGHLGDYAARDRLSRHMSEESIERGTQFERTAGTGAFAGLVVPQYLTDLVAPAAKASRPLADAIRNLPLPAEGMTVHLSRITTATSTAVQTEATSVSETDIDDTILSPSVLTIAGSQTVTRQAVERGSGVLDVVLEDLARAYNSTLDSTLITQGTTGLSAVATGITWTDNTDPTAAELYPKVLQGVAAVEAALLDQDPGDTIIVMHSRRWYWLQAALSSTRPILNQNLATEQMGENFAGRYGSGFRGVIAGVPVIVDNNIATNGGAATNQDEVYVLSASQSFLWEDPNAPMLIRTETGPSLKSLGVDIVAYGYAAYTFARYTHAQKISGTGLVVPTWT